MTELELSWLAGLLEGEGAFTVKDQRKPVIELEMTDEWTVSKAASLMGTAVRPRAARKDRPTSKPSWRTQACGKKCRELLPALRPLMSPRRQERIDDLLDCSSARIN